MSTLATRKQSQAIRNQMQAIRSDLPYAMDDARDDLKQLADWRYYVRKMPLTAVGCVATAAYLAVPKKRAGSDQPRQNTIRQSNAQPVVEEAGEKSFVGGLLGAAAAMALRTGTNMAIRHFSESFMRPPKTR